jgi:hypothetical protein
MPINMDSIENGMAFHVSLGTRAQYGDLVPFFVECASFFPYPAIERDGQVFDNDENFIVHIVPS